MMKMNRRSILKTSSASVAAATTMPHWSFAQAENHTADDLKGVLTPFGALRAGNADGTIPAWTGGGLPGYKKGDPRPIPFADEKPVLVITAANAAQYQDKLTPGIMGMFQKKPDWRIEVYPTHRTAIAPQYVYDYIYQNASSAQLTLDGDGVTGAYGGIPFPIPKSGYEVIWNHLLGWSGTTALAAGSNYVVTESGEVVLASRGKTWFQYPYYFENGKADFNGIFGEVYVEPTAPPYEAGASLITTIPVNPETNPPAAWEYLEGERRVRRAPELQYDTPNSLSAGTSNWDEVDIFTGKLDEYNFKYVDKREIYIPYNTNKLFAASAQEQFLPHFVNPDLVRWELHRVLIVEMTVKPGVRNVDARRLIYCDEDTGGGVLGEIYDANGSLWKFQQTMPVIFPDIPCLTPALFFMTYDLHAGDYSSANGFTGSDSPQYVTVPRLPPSFFTPGQLVANAGMF